MSTAASIDARRPLRGAWPAILAGGLVAGGLDTIAAYVTLNAGWPRAVAGGLLGASAFSGGLGVYALGLFLEFLIATGAAAVYYAFSRRLAFLKPHFFVCGLFFGIAVYLVMNLIVLPLCALHVHSPIPRSDLIQGILVHMFLIGLPIAYSVHRFSP
ncbi:MAG TPA: hypothetical protein VLZ50_09005 [Terracidiphilus sp.]|nr:hypothetical protein [Terracidiphilus sp.]